MTELNYVTNYLNELKIIEQHAKRLSKKYSHTTLQRCVEHLKKTHKLQNKSSVIKITMRSGKIYFVIYRSILKIYKEAREIVLCGGITDSFVDELIGADIRVKAIKTA